MTQHSRLPNIEGMRFLCSLLLATVYFLPLAGVSTLSGKWHLALDPFFLLSGIVIAHSTQGRLNSLPDYRRFLGRRLARLYPLHLATLLFYAGLAWLALRGLISMPEPAHLDSRQLVQNLLMVHAWLPDGQMSFNPVSWSVSALMFAYLLYPLIALLLRENGGIGLGYVLLILVGAILISHIFWQQPFTMRQWDFGIIRALPGFAFGVLLSLHRRHLLKLLPVPLAQRLLLLALPLACLAAAFSLHDYAILALLWVVVTCGYACDLRNARTLVGLRWLSSGGALAYALFMLHPAIATLISVYGAPLMLNGRPIDGWITIITAALLLIAACLSYLLLELPIRHLLRGTTPNRRLA
jgi:peptidoglycan/LPS O-acetylase OafA/YrhL